MSLVSDLLTIPALPSIEQTSINTIRTLSMDGVQAANSGQPGPPMAVAPNMRWEPS